MFSLGMVTEKEGDYCFKEQRNSSDHPRRNVIRSDPDVGGGI